MWFIFCRFDKFCNLSINRTFLNWLKPETVDLFSWLLKTLIRFLSTSRLFDSLTAIFKSSSLWAYFHIINAWCWTNCEFITSLRQSPLFFSAYCFASMKIGAMVWNKRFSIFEKHFSLNSLCIRTLASWVTFLHLVKDFICSPILFLTNLLRQYFFLSIAT